MLCTSSVDYQLTIHSYQEHSNYYVDIPVLTELQHDPAKSVSNNDRVSCHGCTSVRVHDDEYMYEVYKMAMYIITHR